jgi:hypothetical protein
MVHSNCCLTIFIQVISKIFVYFYFGKVLIVEVAGVMSMSANVFL